jgi:hypothetical protein
VKGQKPDNWSVTYNQAGPDEKHQRETQRIVEEGASSYEQMGGEEFAKAAARSHEPGKKTEGKFPPVNTADAARLNAELKAKQTANAAKEKAYRADAVARNERIFAAMKERSNAIHR